MMTMNSAAEVSGAGAAGLEGWHDVKALCGPGQLVTAHTN